MSEHNGHSHDDRFGDSQPRNGHNGHNGTNGHNRRQLSEISHLFLSSLRDREQRAVPPTPRRVPPGGSPSPSEAPHPASRAATPVTAVVGAKLNGTLVEHACAHAASLADAYGQRVGVAVIEAAQLRLFCVEAGGAEGDAGDVEPTLETTNPLEIGNALGEMASDVGQWLVVLPDPRLPQARRLLGRCGGWTLLATASHEGIVSGYRTLKSLCDLDLPAGVADADAEDGELPRVTLAMLDAESPEEAEKAARKLAGVCGQFLDLPVESATEQETQPPAGGWATHALLTATWSAADEAAPAWAELERQLLAPTPPTTPSTTPTPSTPAGPSEADDQPEPFFPETETMTPLQTPSTPTTSTTSSAPAVSDHAIPDLARPMPRPSSPQPTSQPTPQPTVAAPSQPAQPAPAAPQMRLADDVEQVIDLPPGVDVVSAALHAGVSALAGMMMTPIVPPMWPGAKLAVRRDGGLALIAAAAPGLSDLNAVGRAMEWARENATLLSMALGQFRLDPSAPLTVELLVGRGDAGAGTLGPLLTQANVNVHVYRRIRWGDREGMLLEAA